MDEKTFKALREIYQHCCDCSDLSESIGDWDLYTVFEDLRNTLNSKMYGQR